MSFDRLAPHYRWLEAALAGPILQRARTAWLENVPPPHSVLIAGEGPGRFLQAAAAAWPQTRFGYVDASHAMLRQAQRRHQASAPNENRITWWLGSLPEWSPPVANCDLIVTHFFLDCFPPALLDAVVERLASAASPTARWLLADFQEAPHGWRRGRSRLLLAAMYVVFRWATRLPASKLTPPDAALRARGFTLRARRTYNQDMIRSDWWERSPAGIAKGAAVR